MKNKFFLVALSMFIFYSIAFFSSCEKDQPIDGGGIEVEYRGEIISSTLLLSLSPSETETYISDLDPLFAAAFDFTYGVDVYKLEYKTIDPHGNETMASGALAFPNNYGNVALPMVSYQHGTVTKKNKVPSFESTELGVGLVLASGGYITCMPDYLGLGESPGLHPYVHAGSEASATVDMLRASKTVAETNSIAWNDQLFLFGYSQGGHSTMAAHQVLQENHADEFTVTACAPMSGPYDISGVMVDLMLSDQEFNAPYYLPYMLLTYNEIYEIEPSLENIFIEPLDSLLPIYFNGTHGSGSINGILPNVPIEMIQTQMVTEFTSNPDYPLWEVLRDNDTYNWTPTAPIKLYYCEGDELVPYQNSIVAHQELNANGANPPVEITNFGDFTHGLCVPLCFIAAKEWFDELKQ